MADDIKKVGRPVLMLTEKDWHTIDQLCAIQCTGEEIAGVLDIDYDTLNARINDEYGVNFSDYYKRKSSRGKMSLRRKQHEVALSGNPTMLIWLGKQYLEQKDKHEVENEHDFVTPVTVNVSVKDASKPKP